MRHGIKRQDKQALRLFVDNVIGLIHLEGLDKYIRFGGVQLVFYCFIKIIHHFDKLFFSSPIHQNNSFGFSGNGIAQVAAIKTIEAGAVGLCCQMKQPVENFVGIAQAFINIVAGVAAFKAFHSYLERDGIIGNQFLFEPHLGNGIATTSTTDKNLAVVFRIEIEQDSCLK